MSKTLSRTATTLALASALFVGGCTRENDTDGQPSTQGKSAENVANATIAEDGTVPDVSDAAPANAEGGTSEHEVDRANAGRALPDISFTGDDDASVSLADFKGKPMLLNLWATWCIPCIREMPMLDALAGSTAGTLQVVTVSQDLKGSEVVDPFFAKHGYKNLKAYTDPDVKLSLELQAPGLPVTILVDKDGKEVWRITGDIDWMGPEAKKLIAEAGA